MSSSGNVDLQFTASDKAAIAAWQSQQKLADSLIRKLEKLEQVSEKTSKGLDFKNTGIGSVVTDLAKMATSIGSVYAVMRQIRVEYEAILQERGGAALEHVQYRIAILLLDWLLCKYIGCFRTVLFLWYFQLVIIFQLQ